MKELDLHLKLEKRNFASSEVEYLSIIVKLGELAMDPVKLNGIAQWPVPTKMEDIQSFLGFANFYQWFIPDYSNVACYSPTTGDYIQTDLVNFSPFILSYLIVSDFKA